MKKSETVLGVLLAIAATAGSIFAADLTYSFPRAGRFILPPSTAHEIFEQCSRSAPSAKSETWTPSEKDIEELESLLPKYLERNEKDGHPVPPKGKYHRQYVGFMKHGERYIYGSFYTLYGVDDPSEPKHAIQICDGGPGVWGIVYRVKTKTFEDIQFNGVG